MWTARACSATGRRARSRGRYPLPRRGSQRSSSAAARAAITRSTPASPPSAISQAADSPVQARIHCSRRWRGRTRSDHREAAGKVFGADGDGARRVGHVRIGENIGIVEAALTAQAPGIDGEPAAFAEVQHVVVVKVAVQDDDVAGLGKQLAGDDVGASEQAAMDRGHRGQVVERGCERRPSARSMSRASLSAANTRAAPSPFHQASTSPAPPASGWVTILSIAASPPRRTGRSQAPGVTIAGPSGTRAQRARWAANELSGPVCGMSARF